VKPNDFVPVSLEPDPVIEAYKKDIDITLLIENLKLNSGSTRTVQTLPARGAPRSSLLVEC
jgi:hypothetical protein